MNEETCGEIPIPPQKQFLMLVDQIGMALLGRLCPSIKFLEVEGMMVEGNPNHQFIVNPVAQQAPTPTEAS